MRMKKGIVKTIIVSLILVLVFSSCDGTTISKDEQRKNNIYDKVKVAMALDYPVGEQEIFETVDAEFIYDIERIVENDKIYEGENPDLDGVEKFEISLYKEEQEKNYILWYDDLYDKAFLEKEGRLFVAKEDDARYIWLLFYAPDISKTGMDIGAIELFKGYGWTLDYLIGKKDIVMKNIEEVTGFDENAYYFAYNNELSKDIDLDMTDSFNKEVTAEIYRIREALPKEFFPIKDARGIVIKYNQNIVGAYISAGRHNLFDSCSLEGNSFERIIKDTAGDLQKWIQKVEKPNDIEKELCSKEPEDVIREYYLALDAKDGKRADICISRAENLSALTVNMPDYELFNDEDTVPIDGGVENIKSSKLINIEKISGNSSKGNRTYRVESDMEFYEIVTVSNGIQSWDCEMIYESEQTGWKIVSFGHC